MAGEVTKFIYMGDPQTSRISGTVNDYSQWTELLVKAAEMCWKDAEGQQEKVLVLGGDLVNKSTDTDEWEAFFDALHKAEDRLGMKPNELKLLTPTGNHSKLRSYSDVKIFAENVDLPANGPMGLEQNFYSYDSGCVHFIVMDSNLMGNRNRDAYKYIGYWLKSDMAINRKPVTVVVMHHPVETMKTSFDDDVRGATIKENYLNLMYRYGVDFILCGHQHMYSRSKEMMVEDKTGITQIMGVSGTKFFQCADASQMEIVKEFVSVATIFESDGKTIRLKTIDCKGNILDHYEKAARPPKPRKCGSCINFSACKGTGEFEKREAEEKAKALGNPLIPVKKGGLTVKGMDGKSTFISLEEISLLPEIKESYSVMRRGELQNLAFKGKSLSDILARAGIDIGTVADIDSLALLLLSSKGDQKAIKASNVFGAKRFTKANNTENETTVSETKPIIYLEKLDSARLCFVCGQVDSREYNGRKWVKDLVEIELFNYNDVVGTT